MCRTQADAARKYAVTHVRILGSDYLRFRSKLAGLCEITVEALKQFWISGREARALLTLTLCKMLLQGQASLEDTYSEATITVLHDIAWYTLTTVIQTFR